MRSVAATAGMRRLLAVDPSLTCSGWALFQCDSGSIQVVGKLRALPPTQPLAVRLHDLHQRIENLLDQLQLGDNDVLICEAPTTMRDPRAALRVEQVRTSFESIARSRAVSVPGRVNPRTVHHELLGYRGRQAPRAMVKNAALAAAVTLFGPQLSSIGFGDDLDSLAKHQDIVDAILIGAVALPRVQQALASNSPLALLFEERPRRKSRRMRR